MKKRVLVDMDGVLANTYHQFISFHKTHTGEVLDIKDMIGVPEREIIGPEAMKYLYMDDFFGKAPVMDDSQQVMKEICERYDTFIVSAAMEFPQSLIEKYYWLEKYYPFIHWRNIILCGDKTPVKGDYLIDDHFHNLDHFEGQGILFTQPHNQKADVKNNIRANNWLDISKLLLS